MIFLVQYGKIKDTHMALAYHSLVERVSRTHIFYHLAYHNLFLASVAVFAERNLCKYHSER